MRPSLGAAHVRLRRAAHAPLGRRAACGTSRGCACAPPSGGACAARKHQLYFQACADSTDSSTRVRLTCHMHVPAMGVYAHGTTSPKRSPAPGRSPRPRSSSARRRAPTGSRRSRRARARSDGESRRAPSPRRPPPGTSRARRTRRRASDARRPARGRVLPDPSESRMSRSVMIPGPGPSGSITTAAPTSRSDISRATARSVCPGPTVRTVGLIPSRTCIPPPFPLRSRTKHRPAAFATIASM